jgi:DNA-binding NtrC family response regulator
MAQTPRSVKILLLDGHDDLRWLSVLRDVVSTLRGSVELGSVTDIQDVGWGDYDLVLLDAGACSGLVSAIRAIHAQDPGARVVMLSAAPTWKEARELMTAGAVDYARKSLDREDLLATLRRNLTRE